MKQSFLIDVPVLLVFFNRPDSFAKVFEKVKMARPSKLFLACDGPRANNKDDVANIDKCKKIVDDIDWECEVHRNYSEKNLGCGIRPFSAITWAFSFVDRLIILEDDCVPETSLFQFMAELLEKYKTDDRIGMISGLNHFVNWDSQKYSYFFARNGAIWGWATWKRVWKDYDYNLKDMDNPYFLRLLSQNLSGGKRAVKKKIEKIKQTNQKLQNGDTGYWDFQFGILKIVNSYMCIVPKHNLICNIGNGVDSTHFKDDVGSVWKKGQLYFMPTQPVIFPLVHPKFVMSDYDYTVKTDKTWGYPNFFVKNFRRLKRYLKKFVSVLSKNK